MREICSRAEISSHRFQNEYDYGELKADPSQLMARYFDVAFFMQFWSDWYFAVKLPNTSCIKTLELYIDGELVTLTQAKDGHVLNTSLYNPVDYCDPVDHYLSALMPIRDEIIRGDMRAPYLGWLRSLEEGEYDEDSLEPPLPAGLQNLTPAQQQYKKFLNLSNDVLEYAAQSSPPLQPQREVNPSEWLPTLEESEKDELLLSMLEEGVARVRLRYLEWSRAGCHQPATRTTGRTVAGLLQDAEEFAERRYRERVERERVLREEKAAEAARRRKKHLDDVRARSSEWWDKVLAEIEERNKLAYDRAV
ncbi:MAG: hypothetical protein KC561_10965, partial [Myxococcales bacterium]|nr:hypothetical protein [Myxococcales bacterium]